jgi:hypothetical protein
MLTLATVPTLSVMGGAPTPHQAGTGDTRGDASIEEAGDETHNWRDAREIGDGDTYYGHLDRVGDKSDHFTVTAVQHQEVNVHVYLTGHDGVDEWQRPPTTTPPSPPAPPRTSAMLDCYIYHDPATGYPLDGAFNYYYVRHYMLNIVAPMPGTHTYHLNVTIDWAWTPNNYTWDYMLELDVGAVPETKAGQVVSGQLDMAGRDTAWYKVWVDAGTELNGSFEILNFDGTDEESRNVDVWVFPDDLGGYPRSVAWDWSAAPNEPVEPFSILATYGGWYFIKLRGMNHEDTLPCTYSLRTSVQEVPAFPDTGVQNGYFDRHWHDTDWYRFEMEAGILDERTGSYWNEVQYFNMTERADAEDLPDFDLYLFGQASGRRNLDLLDSSFRNDHANFLDVNRDPNRNTEHVSGAAYYSGTYYVEVNAYNNTGYYDLRREFKPPVLSDENNLPDSAEAIGRGNHEGYIHQSKDHYDWYQVNVTSTMRVQFDSFKVVDMFNLSIFKYDGLTDGYRLLRSDWNVHFNLTSRQDEVTNAITVDLDLEDMGLGSGTYHIGVFAAVATGIGTDPVSGRSFVYVTDGEAEAHYELRVWIDGIKDPTIITTAIPSDTVQEDTDLLDHLDLGDHFAPSDPGVDLRYKARIVSGRGRVILEGDSLGFQAAEDYAGDVVVKVTASTTDYIQESLLWTIVYTPVNDAPRTTVLDPPKVLHLPEDSIRAFDLGAWVYDVDEGDDLSVSYDAPEHLTVDLDVETHEMTVVGETDWFGEETVVFTFRDLEGATLDLPVRFQVSNVADAPALVKPLGTVEIMEDTSASIPLYEHIADADGDPLTVLVSDDMYVGFSWDPETGLLELDPAQDWYGGRLLWLTAIDPDGHRLSVSLWLDVKPVPGAPNITSVSPIEDTVTVPEGGEQTFVVLEVTDEESSVLFYKWYLDGELVGPSIAITYRPGIHDQGTHEVSVVVEDEEGLFDTWVWTVQVEDVPHAPDGGIATPSDGGRFRDSEKVPFVALYFDPDGDDLSYSWYIDGELASDDPVFETRMGAGDHRVTLQVTSDGDSVTEELDLTVTEDTSGASTGTVVAIAVIVTAAVGAVAVAARRRRE